MSHPRHFPFFREARRRPASSIIVGVVPGQPDLVARTAVAWNQQGLVGRLHYVFVDPTMTETPGGHMNPIDSDSLDESGSTAASELSHRLLSEITPAGVDADFVRVAGDPAHGLSREARRTDSAAIVVGTRERGPVAALEEWMRGSVSVQLEHIQERPVIVIPLAGRQSEDAQETAR